MSDGYYEHKQCSRCPRVDKIPVSLDELLEKQAARRKAKAQKGSGISVVVPLVKVESSLGVKVGGKPDTTEFEHLCDPCSSIVRGLLYKAMKKQDKASSSPKRTKKTSATE